MKIAVSAMGQSLDSQVDPRFGRCQNFIIVDTDTMDFEAISNESSAAAGGATYGRCTRTKWLRGLGAEVLLAGFQRRRELVGRLKTLGGVFLQGFERHLRQRWGNQPFRSHLARIWRGRRQVQEQRLRRRLSPRCALFGEPPGPRSQPYRARASVSPCCPRGR